MAAISITNIQKAASDAAGTDIDTAYADGIVDELAVEYQPKVTGYTDLSTENRDKVKSSFRQSFAILSRYLLPISGSFTNTSPEYTITSDTQIASITINSFVARTVMISFNLSAWTTAINTRAGFFIKINGTQSGATLKYFFNADTDHRSMGGTFIATIPAGLTTVTGHVTRLAGFGDIRINGDDSITLSMIG